MRKRSPSAPWDRAPGSASHGPDRQIQGEPRRLPRQRRHRISAHRWKLRRQHAQGLGSAVDLRRLPQRHGAYDGHRHVLARLSRHPERHDDHGPESACRISRHVPPRRGPERGTDASCVGTTSTGQPVTLWFMFLQGTSQVGTAQSWSTTVDLLGPSPPSSRPWGPPAVAFSRWSGRRIPNPDVLNYRFFCEDLGATDGITTYEAGAPGPEGGGGQVCVDAGSGGTTDDAGSIDDAGDTTTRAAQAAPAAAR